MFKDGVTQHWSLLPTFSSCNDSGNLYLQLIVTMPQCKISFCHCYEFNSSANSTCFSQIVWTMTQPSMANLKIKCTTLINRCSLCNFSIKIFPGSIKHSNNSAFACHKSLKDHYTECVHTNHVHQLKSSFMSSTGSQDKSLLLRRDQLSLHQLKKCYAKYAKTGW